MTKVITDRNTQTVQHRYNQLSGVRDEWRNWTLNTAAGRGLVANFSVQWDENGC